MAGRAPVTSRGAGAFWAYLLLQVPDILLAGAILAVLHLWANLPFAWAVGVFVAWIVKEIAMYPLVRSAFAPSRTGPEAFIGARGVVKDALAPLGYVRLDGELWRAESLRPEQAVPVGASVVVRAVQGLTFLVEAETPDARRPEEGGSHASRVGQPGQPRL
jgi:membrane protein implicated in regulation of membrane protease activity